MLKSKKAWPLIVSSLLFISLTLFVFLIVPHENDLKAEVVSEMDNGPTTIIIYSSNNLEMVIKYSLLIITFDLTVFTIFFITLFKKINYAIIIICILNILLSILLFPYILFLSIIIDIILISLLFINGWKVLSWNQIKRII